MDLVGGVASFVLPLPEDVEVIPGDGVMARACGEIANAAGVARLVPFHLSRRYLADPKIVFDEIEAVCSCVAVPPAQLSARGQDADPAAVPAIANWHGD